MKTLISQLKLQVMSLKPHPSSQPAHYVPLP